MVTLFPIPTPRYDEIVRNFDSGASVFSTAVSITATAVGAGVLALPLTSAVMGYAGVSVFFAVSAVLSVLMFMLYIRIVLYLDSYFLQRLILRAFGNITAIVFAVFIVLYLIGILSVYLILIANSFSLAMSFLTSTSPDSRYIFSNFRVVVILFSVFVFLLSLPKTLNAIRYFSLSSLIVIGYVIAYLGYAMIRFLSTGGSADLRSDEAIARGRDHPPWRWRDNFARIFTALGTLAFAFSSHLNAPNLTHECYRVSIRKMDKAIFPAFLIIIPFYAIAITFGFILFGTGALDNILLSLDYNTLGAFFANVGVVFFIVVSYAIVAFPVKDQLESLLHQFSTLDNGLARLSGKLFKYEGDGDVAELNDVAYVVLVIVIVVVTMVIALISEEIGLLVSFLGALIASWIIFILPALIYLRVAPRKNSISVIICGLSILYGLFIFTMGGYFSFLNLIGVI
ncbi:hypothetical protein GEMRC1_008100 [Eukaryota sp. GEM-RC1]